MSDDHSLAWGAYGFSIALLVVAAVLLATVFVAPFGDGSSGRVFAAFSLGLGSFVAMAWAAKLSPEVRKTPLVVNLGCAGQLAVVCASFVAFLHATGGW